MVGHSSITMSRQSVLSQSAEILKKMFVCKRVSGRTVQFDKITESSRSGQRKGTLKVVLKFLTATEQKSLHRIERLWSNVKLNYIG